MAKLDIKKSSDKISKQSQYKAISMKLVDEICTKTKLVPDEFYAFLKVIKVKLDSSKATKFLLMIKISDPETVLDAYYSYIAAIDTFDNVDTNRNIMRFNQMLISSRMSEISLDDEIVGGGGMFDDLDSEITARDLDYSIGVLEDEE
jgi:hypothetical protein